jgi:molecular chaperone GrpE
MTPENEPRSTPQAGNGAPPVAEATSGAAGAAPNATPNAAPGAPAGAASAASPPSAPTDAPAAGASSAAPAVPTAEQRLAELEARHAEVSDAYLRSKAEVENMRRRADEEVAKARKFAIDSFAESLLPVKDSLEAAIAAPDARTEQVLEGVHATLRQLTAALERNKVLQISPQPGTKFDPHQHQAITLVPSNQEPNTVVNVLQKGYLISDRVLRPALVTVAAPKPS